MSDAPDLVHVTDVAVIGDYLLRLTFEDGTVGDVSFEDREWWGVFEPLRDPRRFAEVVVDKQMGTIAWPGGLDMAPEPLYAEARAPGIAFAQAVVRTSPPEDPDRLAEQSDCACRSVARAGTNEALACRTRRSADAAPFLQDVDTDARFGAKHAR